MENDNKLKLARDKFTASIRRTGSRRACSLWHRLDSTQKTTKQSQGSGIVPVQHQSKDLIPFTLFFCSIFKNQVQDLFAFIPLPTYSSLWLSFPNIVGAFPISYCLDNCRHKFVCLIVDINLNSVDVMLNDFVNINPRRTEVFTVFSICGCFL